jgi:transcription initiation factor TFIID subunit 1
LSGSVESLNTLLLALIPLFCRSTVKGETKYFLREVKNLFVVGQTYPVTEVPGPHSRKITNTIKYRLQIIAFKLLRKSHEERLKISRLMKYFPDQNELQMRQRLKVYPLIPFYVSMHLTVYDRNLWNIIDVVLIKASGVSNLLGRSLLIQTC